MCKQLQICLCVYLCLSSLFSYNVRNLVMLSLINLLVTLNRNSKNFTHRCTKGMLYLLFTILYLKKLSVWSYWGLLVKTSFLLQSLCFNRGYYSPFPWTKYTPLKSLRLMSFQSCDLKSLIERSKPLNLVVQGHFRFHRISKTPLLYCR